MNQKITQIINMNVIVRFLYIFLLLFFTQCHPNHVTRYEAKKIAIDTLKKMNETDFHSINVNRKNDTLWLVNVKLLKRNAGYGGILRVLIDNRDGKVLKCGYLK
jgi:hypothetical protein